VCGLNAHQTDATIDVERAEAILPLCGRNAIPLDCAAFCATLAL
jgi:hypothetical protein